MAIDINWGLLQPADIGASFQKGYERGQTKSALAAFAQNPDSPAGMNALWATDPDAAIKIGTYQVQRQKAAQDQQATDLKQQQSRAQALAGIAMAGRRLPYEQRRDFIAHSAPALLAIGVKPDALASFDPTDKNIDTLVGATVPVEKQYQAQVDAEKPYTLSPGSSRRGPHGEVIAEQPFAPQFRTVGPDQSLVAIPGAAGGESPAAAMSGRDPYAPIIGAEGGTNPDGSFRTSPKGAVGPGQVMPATGPEAAAYAGVPWDEARYRSDPGYNQAIGRAYHAVMLAKFNGDPQAAAAAYNAGPGRAEKAGAPMTQGDWRSKLPAETRAYIEKAAPGFVGAGARVIAQGSPRAPKDDAPSGYRSDGKGGLTFIPGGPADPNVKSANRSPLKTIPPQSATGIQENISALSKIDRALQAIDQRPNAVGWGTGILGDKFTNWNDPEGVTTRALVGQIAGQKIHDVSGAAVTASEAPRFKPYIPAIDDTPATVKEKLHNLRAELVQQLQEQNGFFSEENGYRPYRSPTQPAGGPPKASTKTGGHPADIAAIMAKYGVKR